MLDKDLVEEKMEERGFTIYSYRGTSIIHFVSEHMYDTDYKDRVPRKEQMPIITVLVNLERDEFECTYNCGLNFLKTPKCGSVLNDEHFDKIVTQFESQAKCLFNSFG